MSAPLYCHAKRNSIPFGLWTFLPSTASSDKEGMFHSVYIPPYGISSPHDIIVNGVVVDEISTADWSSEVQNLFDRFDLDTNSVANGPQQAFLLPINSELKIQLVNTNGNSPLFEYYWNPTSKTKIPLSSQMLRTTHIDNNFLFSYTGCTDAFRIHKIFQRFSSPAMLSRGNLLDWGCGAGRVAFHMSNHFDVSQIFGVDVDPVNIEWCKENALLKQYFSCGITPPTHFPDNTFSFVYGISVMTHLDKSAQEAWLLELHRITHENSIVVLTYHSDSMFFAMVNDGTKFSNYITQGVWDYGASEDLREGFTEDLKHNFYRNTFNTHSSIVELIKYKWELLAIYPGQHLAYHDYVVLRTRK